MPNIESNAFGGRLRPIIPRWSGVNHVSCRASSVTCWTTLLRLPSALRGQASCRCVNQTAFTRSVDATQGVTTGNSAADRAHVRLPQQLIRSRVRRAVLARKFVPAGSPLRRCPRAAWHAEAWIGIARYAGMIPAGVIRKIKENTALFAGLRPRPVLASGSVASPARWLKLPNRHPAMQACG
ncbi:3,4-dihydroxy-2-butanone-4-phosphate synthase [Methylonatrum kenyense]|uniref:3,4-dihydroxy-2-butanone-4-phosphate synthase n=1 Tax=Methylonatrum kenyense TaxID=455253 RepID=UPI003D10A604